MSKTLSLMVFLINIIYARFDLRLNPALYARFIENTNNMPSSFDIMAAELSLNGNLSHKNRDLLSILTQVHIAGSMHGWARSMHQGMAYVNLNTGIGKPNIKIGQQLIPFGLLAWYDTHGRVFQNPYVFTIGERIDAGLAFQGLFGPFDWWYMASNGCGPEIMDQDDNKVQIIRIAHTAYGNWYDFGVGISALRGILPTFNEDPLRNMMIEPDSFVMKNRLAIDGQFSNPYFTLIGEFIVGTNGRWSTIQEVGNQGMIGAYIEMEVPLISGFKIISMFSVWQPDLTENTNKQGLGMGLNYSPIELNNINLQVVGMKYNDTDDNYQFIAQLGVTL